jgi:glucan 1,3-beta-glucosidase
VTPAEIEEDLRLLATVSGCVRTYGLDHGLEAVPAIARQLGLRVVLGAWIGRDARANDTQLTRALALAHEHRDVIDTLIVGNEVLLRRELAPEALAALLARAKRESPVPVAYADVWEFWLRFGAVLRPHVDRVAVHVLPYWEDEPVGIDAAVAHVHAVAARVRRAFDPLPVWVAETGWPAEGRQRGPARPGAIEQARFVRELLAAERAPGATPLQFNLIEGFDQPWKRALEGAMGGYWGVFDAQGRQRVALTGALALPHDAKRWGWAAAAGAFAGAALGLVGLVVMRRRRRQPTHASNVEKETTAAQARWLGTVTLGTSAWAWAAAWQVQLIAVGSRNGVEWALGVALVGLASLGVALELPVLARLVAGMGAPSVRPAVGARRGDRQRPRGWARLRAGVLAAMLFAVAAWMLQLGFDGRYRPLVWPLPMLLSAIVAGAVMLGERLPAQAREERLLAAACALAVPWLLVQEGLDNAEALALAASCAAWATLLWAHRVAPEGETPRTSASAASSRPGAAGVAE